MIMRFLFVGLMALAAVPIGSARAQDAAAATRQGIAVVDQAWRDTARGRDIPVRLYLPAGSGPAPVVIVSHGLGGSREGLAYMGQALAAHGYVAVHVQHPGSDINAARSGARRPRDNLVAATRDPEAVAGRFGDIAFAVDEVLRRSGQPGPLQGRIDGEHMAVLGHSFGAVTSMAVAGQRFPGGRDFRDPRIDVAVALSPSPSRSGDNDRAFGDIAIPVLMFTGTEDGSPIEDLAPERRLEPYQALSRAYRMLVVFDGADHAVFGGRSHRASEPTDAVIQAETARITLAFLDRWLRGDSTALDGVQTAGSAGLAHPGRLLYAP